MKWSNLVINLIYKAHTYIGSLTRPLLKFSLQLVLALSSLKLAMLFELLMLTLVLVD
jgi:hypothetical protein